MPKEKSAKQVRFLMSAGSPLSRRQKDKLGGELHSGAVRVRSGRKLTGRRRMTRAR